MSTVGLIALGLLGIAFLVGLYWDGRIIQQERSAEASALMNTVDSEDNDE